MSPRSAQAPKNEQSPGRRLGYTCKCCKRAATCCNSLCSLGFPSPQELPSKKPDMTVPALFACCTSCSKSERSPSRFQHLHPWAARLRKSKEQKASEERPEVCQDARCGAVDVHGMRHSYLPLKAPFLEHASAQGQVRTMVLGLKVRVGAARARARARALGLGWGRGNLMFRSARASSQTEALNRNQLGAQEAFCGGVWGFRV